MAKKKKTPRPSKKRPPSYARQSRHQVAGALRGPLRKTKPAGPRSQPLPGMERVRVSKLDNLCEGLSEVRASMASDRETEAGLLQAALPVMRNEKLTTYQHAGVELVRVPGEEKLRCRTAKDRATGAVDSEDGAEEPSTAGGEIVDDAAAAAAGE